MASVSIRLNPIGLLLVALGLCCFLLYMFDVPRLFKSEQKVDMKELLSVAIDLAERGGAKVRSIKESASTLKHEVKGKTDEGKDELKTKGDDESHKAIVNGFAKAFPELKVNSEEHNTDPVNLNSIQLPNKLRKEVLQVSWQQSIPISDITVWIDPLDATQEYTEDLTEYVTTMVCVAVRGQPKIGVIHFPFKGETVWAWVGFGYSSSLKSNLERKRDRQGEPYKIIVSRSHAGQVSTVAKNALSNKTVIIPAGGAGYKTVQVIRGEADAYVHVTAIKKWDICAGNAIILAVEGRMTTLQGFDISYGKAGSVVNDKGLLATVRDHKTLLQSLKPAFEAAQVAHAKQSPNHGNEPRYHQPSKQKRSTVVSHVKQVQSNKVQAQSDKAETEKS